MSKKPKPTPVEEKRASREARRLEKASRLPPNPSEGGAYVVGADGQLQRQQETPPETALNEA